MLVKNNTKKKTQSMCEAQMLRICDHKHHNNGRKEIEKNADILLERGGIHAIKFATTSTEIGKT